MDQQYITKTEFQNFMIMPIEPDLSFVIS